MHCFREKALQLGAVAPDTMADQAESATTNAPLSRLVLGALPRGHKVKPLVAEFGDYISVFTDPQRPADLEKFIGTLPKGAKAVARSVVDHAGARCDGNFKGSSKFGSYPGSGALLVSPTI